jgi:hypothetical protein
MATAARAGQFTGATDNEANGGLFTDTKIDGIPDLVAADVLSAQNSATTATTQATTATTQATTATTKAAEAATSATAAASSATAAASSATSASGHATTASNSVSSVNTNATNAAASETAAATSETNAAASASTAATQATNATTQANTALSSSSAASTSATNAATSATTATNYATKVNGAVTGTDFSSKAWAVGGTDVTDTAGRGAAKEWATEAEDNTVDGTSYSALHHATKAAASAAAAAASYDSFDDRYLGPKSSNPTVDNDGATLLDGALYFNTTDNIMLVYDLGNTTWVSLTPTTTNQGHINTVSGIQANVTTVAGISSNVTTVANDGTDIGLVAGSIANVNTTAANITGVNSFAERYRVQSGEPGSSNDEGDLLFDQAVGQKVLKYYNGTAWQGVESVTKGISNGDVLSANANVADNDFLKVDGTSVEGRDSTQVISDLSLDTVKKQGKETIWIPAAAMYPETTNGCAALAQVELANGPELKCLDFDPSSDENAQFSIAFPKSWNEGTVTFSAYFTVSGTNTGDVSWALSGVSLSDNGDLNTAFGTAVAPAAKAHSGTSGDLNVTAESGAITIAGSPAVGDLCFFRIMRDVSADDQSADARLLGIKLHFTTDAANDA